MMRAPPPRPTLATLVAISMLQPIALNLLAPAAPILSRHFETSYATIQLTLTLFLSAVALTQLVIGPLSDRWGRRPCVLAGIGLFILGSVLGALAPDVGTLLVSRVLEGAGSGISFALSRAIIRDTARRDEAASQIASVTMVMVVAPMLAPYLGGQIEAWFGWRAIFWFMFAAGGCVLAKALTGLPETAPDLGRRQSLLAVFSAIPLLARDGEFLRNVAALSTTSGAFFAFVAAAPFIVVETMGRGPDTFGAYFITTAAGYMVGNFGMTRLARRHGAARLVRFGLALSTVSTTLTLALSFAPDWSPATLFVPLILNAVGNGLTIPGSTAEALSARPELAGSAAGLMGAVQLGAGALASVAISALVPIWPQALTLAMAVMTAAGLVAVSTGRRGAR